MDTCKVVKYDYLTNKHTLLYDNGDLEDVNMSDSIYRSDLKIQDGHSLVGKRLSITSICDGLLKKAQIKILD